MLQPGFAVVKVALECGFGRLHPNECLPASLCSLARWAAFAQELPQSGKDKGVAGQFRGGMTELLAGSSSDLPSSAITP